MRHDTSVSVKSVVGLDDLVAEINEGEQQEALQHAAQSFETCGPPLSCYV
jgi:hypothetical protein